MFDDTQWEDMVLKYIVPKLGSTLRDSFDIDPGNQPPLDPLKAVIEWFHHGIIRSSIMSQLLEREFFPKWMAVLHTWLTQPDPSFEEIAQW
jgi:tuftelin-interacting protein 11